LKTALTAASAQKEAVIIMHKDEAANSVTTCLWVGEGGHDCGLSPEGGHNQYLQFVNKGLKQKALSLPVSGSVRAAMTAASAQKEATIRTKARLRQSTVTGTDTIRICTPGKIAA
jgi:hypothetical protein